MILHKGGPAYIPLAKLPAEIRDQLQPAREVKPTVTPAATIPTNGLNWNAGFTIPYRFFFPANNVAVYDHLAADPKLFATAKLVFLTGKGISPMCQDTLNGLVSHGLTVVTPAYLAPPGMPLGGEVVKVYPTGLGRWIVTDQVDNSAVAPLLQPFLGSPDQMRFVFGQTEVIFRQDGKGNLTVEQSPRP